MQPLPFFLAFRILLHLHFLIYRQCDISPSSNPTILMRSLLTLFLAVVSVCSFAQDNIQFGVGKVSSTSGLSDVASNVLQSKLSQILNRNSAATGGEFGVFEVVATIDVESSKSTSGLIKNVMQISGNEYMSDDSLSSSEYFEYDTLTASARLPFMKSISLAWLSIPTGN